MYLKAGLITAAIVAAISAYIALCILVGPAMLLVTGAIIISIFIYMGVLEHLDYQKQTAEREARWADSDSKFKVQMDKVHPSVIVQ